MLYEVITGKSTILALLDYFFPPEKQYRIKACREISFELEKDGYSVISRYSKGAVPGRILASLFRHGYTPVSNP